MRRPQQLGVGGVVVFDEGLIDMWCAQEMVVGTYGTYGHVIVGWWCSRLQDLFICYRYM